MKKDYNKTFKACSLGFITQAICANFLPLLFITFYNTYNISFSRLALLSTCYYLIQLMVDVFCAKVVDKIGYRVCVVMSSVISCIGLMCLSFLPNIFHSSFIGIIICVIIYAIGAGIIEVLVSPMVEACPFENKENMMSLLHSSYSIGTVMVILGSTIFFQIFGIEKWKILAVFWSFIPFYNIFNFLSCPIEKLVDVKESMSIRQLFDEKIFFILVILMICAGASEVIMAQWASAYVESVLRISKAIGDLIGPCGFAVCMGLSRILYGKFGSRGDLFKYMVLSGILCFVCYLLVGLSNIFILSLIGCMMCGFSVGIMWPGSISISSKTLKYGGTAMFALLALAGDFGGAIGPVIVGMISEKMNDNLKIGVLSGTAFPIILIFCVITIKKLQNLDN